LLDQISLYYHEDGFEAKKLLGYIAGQGVPVKAIDVCKTPPNPRQWLDYADRLGIPIEELVNKDHKDMPARKDAKTSDQEWAELLYKSPQLLRYPIAERHNRVAILKTASDIMHV